MRISGLSQIGPEIPLSTQRPGTKVQVFWREVDDYVQHFGNSTKFCARVFSTPGCFRVHRIVCKHSLRTFLQSKTIKAGESIEKAVHCPNPIVEIPQNVPQNGTKQAQISELDAHFGIFWSAKCPHKIFAKMFQNILTFTPNGSFLSLSATLAENGNLSRSDSKKTVLTVPTLLTDFKNT